MINRPPRLYRQRRREAAKANNQVPGSKAEWAMVRQTRWIIRLTFATAVAAIIATAFTGLQWWEAHTGGKTAEKQAEAAVTLAHAAKEQVAVSGQQVATTAQLAVAAELQANAARVQGEAAMGSLRLAQGPNIDLILENIEPYDYNSGFVVNYRVTNTGSYTIRGAKAYAASNVLLIGDIPTIWGGLREFATMDIVPGERNNHHFPVQFPPLTMRWWGLMTTKRAAMVHALRITFKDAAGETHALEHCVAYNGTIDELRWVQDCGPHDAR